MLDTLRERVTSLCEVFESLENPLLYRSDVVRLLRGHLEESRGSEGVTLMKIPIRNPMAKTKTITLYRREVNGKIVELVQREAIYEIRLTIPDPGGSTTTIAASIIDPSFSNPFIHARHG